MAGDGPFLLGEQLSLADLHLAPQLANVREKAPEMLTRLPTLSRVLDHVATRASFLTTTP